MTRLKVTLLPRGSGISDTPHSLLNEDFNPWRVVYDKSVTEVEPSGISDTKSGKESGKPSPL